MKEWKIPCLWTSFGIMKVEADSLAEAIEKANDPCTPLPDASHYVDDSFEIDHEDNVEYIRQCYNEGQEDEVIECKCGGGDVCGDSRFKIMDRAKKDLFSSTNIYMNASEMKNIDAFIYYCWQMGWLDKYKEDV